MATVEIENALELLNRSIRAILRKDTGLLSFEEVYRAAYNLVIQRHGKQLYDEASTVIRDQLSDRFRDLDAFSHEADFCAHLVREWSDHLEGMKMVRDVLMYMDRNYVTQYKRPSLMDLGLKLFQDQLLLKDVYMNRLVLGTMNAIDQYRMGEETLPLVQSLVSIFSQTSAAVDCSDIFRQVFLPEIVKRGTLFYHNKTREYRTTDFSTYVRHGLGSLEVELRLPTEIRDHMKGVFDACWVDEGVDLIPANFAHLIAQKSKQDVKEVYTLFSRTGKGRQALVNAFRQEACQALTKPTIPELIESILSLQDLVKHSLGKEFFLELQSVGENVFGESPQVSLKLSEFIDERVRKGEDGFESALVVFKYMRSKDIFEAYYRYHLGKRLLSQTITCNLDIETDLANKLRQECGQTYITKIEGMLTDVKKSREISWKDEIFHAPIILTTSVWSNIKLVNPRVVLPAPMRISIETFTSYYTSRFSGRKLTWVLTQGSVEMKHVAKNCLLSVSTIQAIILDQFNEAETLSVDIIAKKTNLIPEEFQRHLMSLHAKYPILKKGTDESFSVNENFEPKSRFIKVPLIVDSTAVGIPEITEDTDTGVGIARVVEEDRKHLIEAAIVRILKSKRQLDHASLMLEMTKHLENRFVPSTATVKEKIENLIDREYIARDNDDVNLYYYVA